MDISDPVALLGRNDALLGALLLGGLLSHRAGQVVRHKCVEFKLLELFDHKSQALGTQCATLVEVAITLWQHTFVDLEE